MFIYLLILFFFHIYHQKWQIVTKSYNSICSFFYPVAETNLNKRQVKCILTNKKLFVKITICDFRKLIWVMPKNMMSLLQDKKIK